MPTSAAQALAPLVTAVLGDPLPVEVRFWDGSRVGTAGGPATIILRSPDALRRILWSPNEVGFARAFVTSDVEIEGDLIEAMRSLFTAAPQDLQIGTRTVVRTLGAALRLGVLGPPPAPPAEEARLRGGRHSRERDAAAIAHHYDVGNEFYRLILGESMTYSCARFVRPDLSLDEAQAAKYDLICRKLGLREGMRLLDVGCGWGGMAMHAAAHYRVAAVGITLSEQQYDLARKRVAEAGLSDWVEIRLQDYRDVGANGERFDAISSIGMFEHVGKELMAAYFSVLSAALVPGGRLLNHAISTPEGASFDRRSFTARYVFPDGELEDVADVVEAMEKVGLEVRDVESLREHYALTLRHWVENLDAHWDEAVSLVGLVRARIWRLYMAAAVIGFELNQTAIHQVLGVKTHDDGTSGMPLTRSGMI
ncbi:MAG TPA: cyclopropane-fatty-acyl-phospholipid synthase family protein [Acidimicrobiales bacterium]|jgi:cyclopropane-fatty-acyl-phospholipid synthase|nr:cyclopropane-fatty-acyl-phospholipid synthase family protein [Acidimicrobiales bacterium]